MKIAITKFHKMISRKLVGHINKTAIKPSNNNNNKFYRYKRGLNNKDNNKNKDNDK